MSKLNGGREFSHEARDAVQRHEEHDGARGHKLGRHRRRALFARTRADEDLVRDVALRRRDRAEQRRAQRARNPRQHGDAVAQPARAKVHHLFAAAAVDERVALFEAEDGLAGEHAGVRGFQELLLRAVGVAGEFARNVHGRAARDQVEHACGHELVGEDQVGAENGLVRGAREQVRVARPAAGEDEPAELGLRSRVIGAAAAAAEGRRRGGTAAGVTGEQPLDVVVGDGREAAQRPVFAHLAEPAHASRLDVFVLFGDEFVKCRVLSRRVVVVRAGGVDLVLRNDAPAGVAEAGRRGAELRGEGGRNLAADARGELAPAAVGRDADLQRPVDVGGEESERAEVRGVDDVDGNAVALAEGRDVCTCSTY